MNKITQRQFDALLVIGIVFAVFGMGLLIDSSMALRYQGLALALEWALGWVLLGGCWLIDGARGRDSYGII